jgi:hypothetical protein
VAPWALASLGTSEQRFGPVEHRLGEDTQEAGDAVHREATQVAQYRRDLRREGLAAQVRK